MDGVLINLTVNLITSGVIISLLVHIAIKLGKLEESNRWIKERVNNHEERIRELERKMFEKN